MGLENVPRCQHVKVNGTQCGSPALRRRRHCFFHDRIRREKARSAADVTAQRMFAFPLLEDANSVQVALMKVIQMLGSGRVDHKTAGLILYALQTASVNLRNVHFEVRNATDVVIDRDTVNATSIGGPQWFEEDFEEEVEDEEEDEVAAGADGEEPAGHDGEGTAESGGDDAPEVKHVSIEEARLQVQGVVRSWLLERGANIAVKPG